MTKTFKTMAVAASLFALPAMAAETPDNSSNGAAEFGRKITQHASTPKFGGYFIGKYDYTDKDGQATNGGFAQRLIRVYVDGKIFDDFAYRIQAEVENDKFHMKDYFVEWQKYKEFRVKFGQYKRAFGFENPMNPWDVGVGDYSQVTRKFAGFADHIAADKTSHGGRDQGLQFQGDLFPVSEDQHSLIHYQLMFANGQGINAKDANKHKDVIGTLQVQPVKGLYIGGFAWNGKFTANGVEYKRNRYIIAAKYDKNDWTFRSEWAYSEGDAKNNLSKADAWYATLGVPVNDWLKVYGKYDVYRSAASWNTSKSIYSIAPNFQIHKNLMLQLQYNYVNDRAFAKDKHYNELWAEAYVRF